MARKPGHMAMPQKAKSANGAAGLDWGLARLQRSIWLGPSASMPITSHRTWSTRKVQFATRRTAAAQKASAAASAALSTSLGRQLYLRLVVETLFYEQPELKGKDLRTGLRISGILATDANSLFDTFLKGGSTPVERQTLIDVLVAKDLVEQKCFSPQTI